MRGGWLSVWAVALLIQFAVADQETVVNRRFLGNGQEIHFGDGTRDAPFNKPVGASFFRDLLDEVENRREMQGVERFRLLVSKDAAAKQGEQQRRRLKKEDDAKKRELQQTANTVLDRCYEVSDETMFGDVTLLHPCFNKECKLAKSSEGCLSNVYDFCCDEELEDCNPSEEMKTLRSQTTCTANSCSNFMGSTDYGHDNPSFDPNVCPFSDATVCSQSCASQLWQVHESYVYDGCAWNRQCLKNQVGSYSPPVAQVGARLGRPSPAGRPASFPRGLREIQFPTISTVSNHFMRSLQTASNNVGDGDPSEAMTQLCEANGGMEVMFSNLGPAHECFGVSSTKPLNIDCEWAVQCLPGLMSSLNMTNPEDPEGMGLGSCVFLLGTSAASGTTYQEFVSKAGPIAEEWEFNFVVDFMNKMDTCDNNDNHEGGSGGSDGSGGSGGDDGPECQPEYAIKLFENLFVTYGVDDCIGSLDTLDCTDLMGCLPLIYNATEAVMYGFEDENPYIACLIGVASIPDVESMYPEIAPIFGENPPSIDDFYYVQKMVGGFEQCTDGDDGHNGGGGGGHTGNPNWNYTASCHADWEEEERKCGNGCCALHDGILAQDISGIPMNFSAAYFPCIELAKAGGSEYDVMQCLRVECGGCYAEGGGLYGPPSWEETNLENPYESPCVAGIFDHCTANPTDPACMKECPFSGCDSRKTDACPCDQEEAPSCAAVYAADFNVNRQCKPFQEAVLNEYLNQGFLYPEMEWAREHLAGMGVHVSEPTGSFHVTDALLHLANETACPLVEEIVDCMGISVSFCNSEKGMWSPGCRVLSKCGDGRISWGEECDDGNTNHYEDGCRTCNYVPDNWYCPGPGKPCEVCMRSEEQQNYRGGPSGRSDSSSGGGCPFCQNQKLENLPSPCYSAECRSVSDYHSAVKCDEVIHTYCQALAKNGLHDPGCLNMVNKSVAFAVPQIPRCEYSFRNFQVNGKNLKSRKYLIVECPLVDPTGEGRETTPYVPYWAPYYGVSNLNELTSANRTALEALLKAERGNMVPLTNLTDHETFAYDNININKDGAPVVSEWEFPLTTRVARLMASKPEDKENNYGDEEWCDYPEGQYDLEMVPPCEDVVGTIARRGLKQIKWKAALNNDWDFQEFVDMDLSDMSKFKCNPKPGVVQFVTPVSQIRMEWKGNREVEVENQEKFNCDRFINEFNRSPTWEEQKNGACDSLNEATIQQAYVSFSDKLFQSICTSKSCKQTIARCAKVPLVPAREIVKLDDFKDKADTLLETIYQLEDTTSWGEVKRVMIEVSAMANSVPIQAAMDVFNQVTKKGTFTKVLKGVKDYCPHDYWLFNETSFEWSENMDWKNDPCCNWELREIQCCPVQDVPGATVQTITDFYVDKLNEKCKNPDVIKSVFNELFQTLENARKEADKLSKKADPTQFENVWEFEDDCRDKIENRNQDVEINSQADCYCKYSQFVDDGNQKRCETAPEEMPKCFAECFREKYESENSYIVKFLMEEWGVSIGGNENNGSNGTNVEDESFANAWAEKMTEFGCSGPRQWESDIGWSGWQWRCDNECQANHTCSYYDVLEAWLQPHREETNEWISAWELNNNNETCARFNGTRVCQYPSSDGKECWGWKCEIPELMETSIPCEEQDQCRQTCQAPCNSKEGCEAKGGTWLQDQQSCCPAHAYVRDNNGYVQCSMVPPGKPDRWELRDELCCAAEGGAWRSTKWGGECCLGGVFEKYNHDGEEYWYCRDWVDSWEECHECEMEMCEPLRDQCETCWKEREGCCKEEYVSQNMTACLRYETCNDASVWDVTQCTSDPDPFCTTEWGHKVSQPAVCAFDNVWSETDCITLGGTWDSNQWPNCRKPIDGNATVDACFDTSVCPIKTWEEKYPGWEKPENGYWERNSCQAGCLVPANNSAIQQIYDHGCSISYNNQWGWAHQLLHESTICKMSEWSLKDMARRLSTTAQTLCETTLEGTYIPYNLWYESPRFMDQSECETGWCEGTVNQNWRPHPDTYEWLGPQPWSEDQCMDNSEYMCDRWCPYCQTRKGDEEGACFDETDTIVDGIETMETCVNNTGYNWYACPTPPKHLRDWQRVSDFCTTDLQSTNLTTEIASQLGCFANFDRCKTKEECNAQGHCNSRYGWLDLETRYCEDYDWIFGDRHWAYAENDEGNLEWQYCRNPKTSAGVCIAERHEGGCAQEDDGEFDRWWRFHPFGCRVDNMRTKETCNHTWYDPIENEEQCEAIQACRLNRWEVRLYGNEECTRCGGEMVQFAQWYGGEFRGPFLRRYEWNPEGRKVVPVNKWVGRQATWKLKEELKRPVIRAYAQYKMQELLQTYNAFRSALEAISCDCGGGAVGDDVNCFAGFETGDVTGRNQIFDGQTIEMGTVTIQGLSAESRRRRRLDGGSSSSSSTATVSDYSAGIYTKHEPCSNESDAILFDALVVKNTAGVVVGQLIGNGKGLNVSGGFESALVCMDARADMNIREDMFTVYGVGVYNETSGNIEPVFFANDTEAYVERTASRICIEVTDENIYYPIARVPQALAEDTNLSCQSCEHGTCAVNAATSAAECVCECGFSGESCSTGCSKYCNNQGQCDSNANTCSCDMGATKELFAGPACGRLNCPVDENGNLCSRNGACVLESGDYMCNCTTGFTGDDCGTMVQLNTTNGDLDNGFGNVGENNDNGFNFNVNTPAPTMPPTNPTTGGTSSPVPSPTEIVLNAKSSTNIVGAFMMTCLVIFVTFLA